MQCMFSASVTAVIVVAVFVTAIFFYFPDQTNNYYKNAAKKTRNCALKLRTYWSHNNNNAVLWTSIDAVGMCNAFQTNIHVHDTYMYIVHCTFILLLCHFLAIIFSLNGHSKCQWIQKHQQRPRKERLQSVMAEKEAACEYSVKFKLELAYRSQCEILWTFHCSCALLFFSLPLSLFN